MRNKEVLTIAGVVAGVAGVVTLGLLLKKFIANKKVEQFEEELVQTIVEKSPFHAIELRKKSKGSKVKLRKVSILATAKLGNAKKLLDFMKREKEYTQVMLETISKIPYRSVRRYIDILSKQGKIVATGYGKGKKFMKV